jgi:hypothetical protein
VPAATAPAGAAPGGISVDPVVADARAYFEERAALVEEGAEVSRERAEAQAARETLAYLESANQIDLPKLRPLVRYLRIRAAAEPDMGPPTPPIEAYAEDMGVDLRQLALPISLQRKTQEAPDAQLEPGPTVDVVPDGDRRGVEGDVAPDEAPVVAAPDVGETLAVDGAPVEGVVLGVPSPDAPEGAQPAALSEAVSPAPEPVVARQMALDEADKDALAAKLGVDRPGVVDVMLDDPARASRAMDEVFREKSAPVDQESFAEKVRRAAERGYRSPPDTLLEASEIADRMAMAQPRVDPEMPVQAPTPSVAPEAQTRAAMPSLSGVGDVMAPRPVVAEPAAVERVVPETQEDMTRVMDDLDIGRGTNLRRMVRDGEIASPEAFLSQLERTRIADPELRKRRDDWLQTTQDRARAAAADPAVDRVVSQFEEIRQRAEVEQSIAQWFEQNVSDDLKLAEQLTPPGERETSPLPAQDLRTILDLVQSTKENARDPLAAAAVKYFGRTSDPGYALHMIAHDAAQARGEAGQRIPKQWKRDSLIGKGRNVDADPLTDTERADLALLSGQGWDAGQKAVQWVEANLSPEAADTLVSLRDGRATILKPGYAWINYEMRSSTRDRVRGLETEVERAERESREQRKIAQREARAAEIAATEQLTRDQAVRDQQRAERETAPARPISLAPMPWDASAGITTWPGDAHPRVGTLIRAGLFGDAMRVLAATAPNQHMRELAEKILARVSTTPTQVVPAETMNRIRDTLSPETPTLGVESMAGVYVHPRSPEQIDAMRREGHEDAAALVEEFGGQILFNEETSIAPELVLHEAIHAVGDNVLANKSHPLTRQLDALRINLLKFMPATHYGLSNVREFFAEGMTNPLFRRELSYVNVDGKPFSAWQQFKHTVRNWLRGLVGRQPVKQDTAMDAVDRALNAVMSVNPSEMNSGDIVGASFSPGGARQVLRDAAGRVRVPTKADLQQTRQILQDTSIPSGWKGALMRLFMPLDYVADAAKKYMPSARKVHDLVMQHQAEIQRVAGVVSQTTESIAKTLSGYRNDQGVIDNFNRVLFQGTLNEVDVRKPRSNYEGYSFRYAVLDADGNRVRTVESKRYPDDASRNAALRAYNDALPPDAPNAARARRSFDQDAEQLAAYDRLRPIYDSFPQEVKSAVARAFELPVALGRDLTEAIRARLESLLPNQRSLQDKVYGIVYEKILAGQLIDPYQPLRREGEYWLAYEAIDPETGTTEVFKHAFNTEGQREAAIRMLEAAPADQQIRNIEPYQNVGSMRARARVPMEFVARVLDAVDGSAALDTMIDPETGQPGTVKAKIIELMFDTLPETSFVNSFRRRANIRGFKADFTPITQGLTAGDTVKNLRESSMKIGRQVADLKYGAAFSAARTEMEAEFREFQGRPQPGVSAFTRGRQLAEAQQYHDLLSDYTGVPFRKRAGWSRSLTGGAYMMTLGFNVSTAMITLSQVPLFVAPFLAGKHGMRGTMSAIGEANRVLASSGRERTIQRIGENGQIETVRVPVRIWDYSLDNYDFSDPANTWLSGLHDFAKRNGVFNRSLLQDELLGEQPTTVQRIAAATGIMQHHAERYSRETALIAAYGLELQQQMGNTQSFSDFVAALKSGAVQPSADQIAAAAEAAVNVSEKTNGPIYAAAGPMASQGDIGAIAYLFKRHPLSMLNLIGQTAMRANPFGTNDPADRKIAQRQFAGMMGMVGLMSGALGLPLMQQIGWLYDLMFTEDDEPDFESTLRITLGEAGSSGLIDYLTGLKVSERIGLGSAIYRPGFAAERLPLPYQVLEGLGGPVLGLGLKYTTRVPKLFSEGEYQRGLEAVLPSSFANVARAVRFGAEGVRTMRGDPVIEDVGPFGIAAQALGFMPAAYAQQLAINSLGTRIDNAITTKRSRLLQKRYKAFRDGDFATMREIDDEIAKFNARHPGNQIGRATLRESLRSHEKTTSRMHHGVAVSPRNEAYIRSITDAFGPATAF